MYHIFSEHGVVLAPAVVYDTTQLIQRSRGVSLRTTTQ